MKKVFKIEGLDCASCAKILENQINKIDLVDKAEIDFLKSTICIESEDIDKALKQVILVTKEVEPDAKIVVSNNKKDSRWKLIIDVVALVVGVTLSIVCNMVNLPLVAFWILLIVSLILLGYKTYYKAIRLLCKGVINENLLLTIAVVGAVLLGEYMEASMVIALYSIGKIFESLAVDKSRKSIEKLTNLQPEYANLLVDDKLVKTEPSEVKIGSIIVAKPGERVPIDGKIVDGKAMLDMQSLTGESLPVQIKENEEILSGSIVLDGVLKVETTSEYKDSTVSRIMDLIEHASEKKSKAETLISKITRWYTLGVIIFAVVVWLTVWLVTKNMDTAIYRGLIFLVISCPCAFAISVPLTYFSGIGNASRHGILIKGSNYLDACSKLKVVAFDKTGTLTTGKFVVREIQTFKGFSEEEIIYLASLGEQYSLHPLAKSIVSYNKKELDKVSQVKEVAGEGVYYVYEQSHYFVGRKNKKVKSTTVELYKDEEKIGEIKLEDEIKKNSSKACSTLKDLEIETILLSGDNKESVDRVVNELNMSKGYNNLLPEDKYKWIEQKKENLMIGYVGDGINDAPSLTLADVGISMGINGSASSIEASDIVLVDDDPSKVTTAIKISKYTQKIVWQNIILSAGIKFIFLALGTFGITGMFSAVFADVGVTLIAILNSMRALTYSPK